MVGTVGGFWNCRLHCSRSCLSCLVRVDVDRGVCGGLVGVVEVCGVVVGVNGSARLDSCIVVGVCRIVVVVVVGGLWNRLLLCSRSRASVAWFVSMVVLG